MWCEQNKIIHDCPENADVRQNEYHKRLPLSTTGIPRFCCVLLMSNAKRTAFLVEDIDQLGRSKVKT